MLASLLAVLGCFLAAPPASAATIQMTTSSDESSGAAVGAGCSLREAVLAANGDAANGGCPAGDASGTDEISFAVGTNGTPIVLSLGTLALSSNVKISGNGTSLTIVDGNQAIRPFAVLEGTTAEIASLTIRNGRGTTEWPFHGEGGGIWSAGTLTISHITVTDSTAGNGGGICNRGLMNISYSSVQNSTVQSYGGGIINYGRIEINDSIISGNKSVNGGGISNEGRLSISRSAIDNNSGDPGLSVGGGILSTGPMDIVDSLISNNNASSGAGIASWNEGIETVSITGSTVHGNVGRSSAGILAGSPMTIHSSTISNNGPMTSQGGDSSSIHTNSTVTLINSTLSMSSKPVDGISISGGSVEIRATTLDNAPGFRNCATSITSRGSNVADDATCFAHAGTDQVVSDVGLAPLADNGGPTKTHALRPGSPAIDRGDAANCSAMDQRGQPRPRDGDGNGSPMCDAGAYELQAPYPSIASFTINAGQAVTSSTAVTLSLAAPPSAAQMSFSNTNNGTDWSEWQTFATQTPWSLAPGDGTKTVYARIRGADQLVWAIVSDTIALDSTAPPGTLSINDGEAATNSLNATLTFPGLDPGTGVSEMRFSNTSSGIDSAAWEPFAATKTWTLGEGADGPRTVYVQVKDGVGNVSPTVSDTILYDGSAPTMTSLVVNSGALATTSTAATLTLQAADTGGSNLSQMSFSNDGGATWSAWEAFAATKSWTLTSGDGPKTVHARVRDGAGNVSAPISKAITLDTAVGTSYGISIDEAAVWTNTPAVTLDIAAPPGTALMLLSNDGGFAGAVWEPFNTRKSWTLNSFGAPVTMNVYVRFATGPGQEIFGAARSDDIVLDITPPSGSVAVGGTADTANATMGAQAVVRTVQLTATDTQSGAAMQMRLSNRADFAGAIWKPFASSVVWDFSGGGTVYAQFKDGAGNVSQAYSQSLPGGPGPGTSGTPSCSPRPRVNVSLQQVNGTLRATLATTGANNGLRAVRFDTFTTAIVDVGDQVNQTQPFAVSIPAGLEPTLLQFTIRRLPPSPSATVRLVVIDGCGEWSTLLGGGPKAWGP